MSSYGRPLIEAACHAYLYAERLEQHLRQWNFRVYNLSALAGAEKSEEVEMKASEDFPEGSLHIYRGEVLRVVGYDHTNSAVTIMYRNGVRQTHPASWLRERMRPFAINTGDVWRGQPPNPQVGVVLNVNVEAESAYLDFGNNMRAWRSFSWIGANLTLDESRLEGGVMTRERRIAHNRPRLVELSRRMLAQAADDVAPVTTASEHAHQLGVVTTTERMDYGGMREAFSEVWPETSCLSGREVYLVVLQGVLRKALEAIAREGAFDRPLVGLSVARSAGLHLNGGDGLSALRTSVHLAWPATRGRSWAETCWHVLEVETGSGGLWADSVVVHAKPRPSVPPLTGYAAAHAEMLGVTPAQYRAARPEVTFGRKARRALFARRVQALVEQPDRVEPPPSAPVDLTGAGGVPWGGRGVGPDLPYDPEEP